MELPPISSGRALPLVPPRWLSVGWILQPLQRLINWLVNRFNRQCDSLRGFLPFCFTRKVSSLAGDPLPNCFISLTPHGGPTLMLVLLMSSISSSVAGLWGGRCVSLPFTCRCWGGCWWPSSYPWAQEGDCAQCFEGAHVIEHPLFLANWHTILLVLHCLHALPSHQVHVRPWRTQE